MGQAKRRGTAVEPPKTRPLTGEEALQVTILGTCQIALNALTDRVPLEPDPVKREKRKYWIDRMLVAIEGIDLTLDGWVTEEFEKKFNEYHQQIDTNIKNLIATHTKDSQDAK